MAALSMAVPANVANDNIKPRSCTWTTIIRAMAKVGPDCERSAWMARKKGWTAQQYVDRMVAAYEGTGGRC